jgi:hypothetical protein
MTEETSSTAFVVDLEGLKLHEDTIRRIESGIRALVMQEIAKIDHQGDIVVKNKMAQTEATRDVSWLGKIGPRYKISGLLATSSFDRSPQPAHPSG